MLSFMYARCPPGLNDAEVRYAGWEYDAGYEPICSGPLGI
jgi:hypothetical protein